VQARLHRGDLHRGLRLFDPLPTVRGALWGLPIRAAALVAILLVAGCGGSGSPGDADPATAAPAEALVYVEVVARPEGSLREAALEAAGKILATDDPEGRIRELVHRAVDARGENVDYARDVEPWLGERAALWVGPLDDCVVLLAATDTDKAWDSLERAATEVTERAYRGGKYLVDSSGMAAGVLDGFVAIGREASFKRTVDAAAGDSLAEADEYDEAVGGLADERLAHFWVDTRAVFERAARDDPELDRLRSVVPADALPPMAGALLANGERVALEVQAGDDLGLTARGTPLLEKMPGDAWAAMGSADVGASLRDALDRFAGPIGGVAIRGQLRRELGLDLDRDVLDWIGDAGFFVRGTSPGAIDGGLVIQPTDEERAVDAFGRIVGAIQQARGVRARPVVIAGADQAFAIQEGATARPIVLARGSGLVVATVGEAAAEAALGAGDRLGETEAFAEAEELVATEPSLFVSLPPALELAGNDPEFADARRYLEVLTVIAAGTEGTTARLAAGLR
jgi:hypothetical protein